MHVSTIGITKDRLGGATISTKSIEGIFLFEINLSRIQVSKEGNKLATPPTHKK
jgi:hypothetical protein